MDSKLAEAAQSGNIDLLYELIQADPYVLDRVDGVPFVQTPLHVAAVEGEIEFAMEMMNLKPSFESKLNPQGFSPMHLALNNQRTKLVLQLLRTNKELVRVKGKKGITPFHLTVSTGDTELVLEFLEACPECIQDLNVKGETAWMIALRNEKMETFEALVRWLERCQHKDAHIWEDSIVNHRDNEGNTVPRIVADQTLFTAGQLLLNSHLPVKLDADADADADVDIDADADADVDADDVHVNKLRRTGITKRTQGKRGSKSKYIDSKLSFLDRRSVEFVRPKNNMSMDFINALLVIAALVITTAYQSSLSPPGSVWQGGHNSSNSSSQSNFFTVAKHQPGSTVMNQILFLLYSMFNTIIIWSGIVLIKRLFSRGALLLTMPLYLLGTSFQLSMCVLSPNTWILWMQYVLFLCIIAFSVLPVLKDRFQRAMQPDDPRLRITVVLAEHEEVEMEESHHPVMPIKIDVRKD